MRRPVLVTGPHGFVGRHLMAELGEDAVAAEADVLEPDLVRAAIASARPEAVVHLAARSSVAASWRGAAEVWRVNVVGTVNVLDAVRAERPDARVLVISSGEVYGRARSLPVGEDAAVAPLSPYAASKAAAELACDLARRADGLDVVVARPFTHIGPGQSEEFAVGSWTRQIARAEITGHGTLRVGDLSVRRDLTDVRDVCRAYRLLLVGDAPADIYNVAQGAAVALSDVAELLVSLAACPIRIEPDPTLVRSADVPVFCGDATKLRAATGWTPEIPLERTLVDALEEARRKVRTEEVASA